MNSVAKLRRLPRRLWNKTDPLRKNLQSRLDLPKEGSTAVFLIGCGRSGTNMVARRISRSWQVSFYNEGDAAAFDDYRLKAFPVIDDLRRSSGTRITLFKPILDTHLALKLLDELAPAKLLFVYRHYSDVINSSIKRFGPENWPGRVQAWMEADFAEFAASPPPQKTRETIRSLWQPGLDAPSAIALYWLFYNRLYFDLHLDRNPQAQLIPYELAVSQPETEFQALSRFLGIRYFPEMIAGISTASVKKEEGPQIVAPIRECCDELWLQMREQRVGVNG